MREVLQKLRLEQPRALGSIGSASRDEEAWWALPGERGRSERPGLQAGPLFSEEGQT